MYKILCFAMNCFLLLCSFSARALRWIQTMTFAVKEINKRRDLLPQLKLGFHIRDSCDDIPVSLRASLLLVNGQPERDPRVKIEDKDKGVGRTINGTNLDCVSYFASCSCLSDQGQFPTFMRTMPSDAFQIRALARLVSYFGWTWVGLIASECCSGTSLSLQTSQAAIEKCFYYFIYPKNKMQGILREVRRWNITGLQWIASEAWATATLLWARFGDLLKGTLGFAIRRADVIPGLKQHLTSLKPSNIYHSAFLTEYWEETFNCRLNGSVNSHFHGISNNLERLPCKGTENLDDVYSPYSDVTQLRVSYNVYKAVYLVAHALQDMNNCKVGQGPFLDKSKTLHSFNFDQNGDPIAYYDLMNWQRAPDGSLHLIKVGFYDASSPAGHHLRLNFASQASRSVCSDSCPPGSRITRRKGEPICCFDCVPCAEGEVSNQTGVLYSLECFRCSEDTWPNKARDLCLPKTIEYLSYHELMGMLLCAASVLGACISLSILAIFFIHKDTPLVRANNMELSFLLLLFLAVCFLVSLLFIGEPSDWLCRVRYPAFGISFALCISCLLAKTAVVLVAFRSTMPGSNVMKWFGPNQQRANDLIPPSAQVIICLIWLLSGPPHANSNSDYHSAIIIIECVTGSEAGFWCVLGYIGVLACMCFLMAFLARKLPDNFNEAKFITFSMLIFFAVWMTFIPVYVSTAGKYTVAVHVFAILASAFGLVFCIFAPKCYIIIVKPEKNNKKSMMQR
uniref:Olfactory receptor C family, x3 n=1 Tax=Echeneis naucrates TaxID=173247 RepID=A0A665T201_ECHNA